MAPQPRKVHCLAESLSANQLHVPMAVVLWSAPVIIKSSFHGNNHKCLSAVLRVSAHRMGEVFMESTVYTDIGFRDYIILMIIW